MTKHGVYKMKNLHMEDIFVDVKGNIKASNLLRYFQSGATSHFDDLGYYYQKMTSEFGIVFLVTKYNITVYKRPRIDENIWIETWIRNIHGAHWNRDYEIYSENNDLLVACQSKWVTANPITHKIVRPSTVAIEVEKLPDKSAKIKTIALPNTTEQNYSKIGTRIINVTDLDMNNHMNNANYLDIAEDYFYKTTGIYLDFKNLEIVYRKEAKLSDELKMYYAKKNDYNCIVGKINDTISFEVKAK